MAQTPKTATQLSDISMGELVSTLKEETKTLKKEGSSHTFCIGDNRHIKLINKEKKLQLTIKNEPGAGKISLVDDVKGDDEVVHNIAIKRDHKNAPPRKLRATRAGTYNITLKHPGQLSSVEIGTKPRITLEYDTMEPMTPQDRMIFLMASLHDNVTIPHAKTWDDQTFDNFMKFVLEKKGIKVQDNRDVDIDLECMVRCFACTGEEFPEIPSNFANGIVRELNSLRKKGYRIRPMKGTSKEAKALFKKMNLVQQEQKKIVSQQKEEVSVSTTPQKVSVVTTKAPLQQRNPVVQKYIKFVKKALKDKKVKRDFIKEVIQGLSVGGVILKKDRQNKPELVLYPDQILKQKYNQGTIEKLAEILYEACPEECFVRVTKCQQKSSLARALKTSDNLGIVVLKVLAAYGR